MKDRPGRITELYTNQVIPYYRAPHLLLGFPTRYVAGRGSLTPLNERLSRIKNNKRLGTDYIDLYQFHQVGDSEAMERILDPEEGFMKTFEDAKKAGKILHIGATSHKLDVAKELVKSERFETVMFPFNFITCEPADELLPLCKEHDVGFIDMKPMAGGHIEDANLAFKYFLDFDNIVPLVGIEKPEEIRQIVKIFDEDIHASEDELRQMGTTRDMVFNIRQLIVFISSVMTLDPGDLILTGTPAGVGPLQPGDQVTIIVEGLGEITNPIEAEPDR